MYPETAERAAGFDFDRAISPRDRQHEGSRI
jgi:hypothetical protein